MRCTRVHIERGAFHVVIHLGAIDRGAKSAVSRDVRTAWLVIVMTACSARQGTSSQDPADGKADGAGSDVDSGIDTARPSIWTPRPGTTWQWQLTGAIDTSLDVAMYDIDLFDATLQTITTLHAAGRKVICYFSAGSHENWRPDQAQFPAVAIGSPLDGWPGERWLDTRSPAVRELMRARLGLAVGKHCDGVEPDNVDAFVNMPGFPLTAATQLDYNRFLATEAHARGLSVGLKNDLDQVTMLLPDFDWALDEQCFQFTECDKLAPFITANKAVFQVEYGGPARATAVCASANARNFDTLVKSMDLGVARIACR